MDASVLVEDVKTVPPASLMLKVFSELGIITLFTVNVKSNYFDKLTTLTTNSNSFFLSFLFLMNILYVFIIQFFVFQKN